MKRNRNILQMNHIFRVLPYFYIIIVSYYSQLYKSNGFIKLGQFHYWWYIYIKSFFWIYIIISKYWSLFIFQIYKTGSISLFTFYRTGTISFFDTGSYSVLDPIHGRLFCHQIFWIWCVCYVNYDGLKIPEPYKFEKKNIN